MALICLEQWDKSDEDRVALIGLGFAAIVALWASANLISVILLLWSFKPCFLILRSRVHLSYFNSFELKENF